MANAMTDAFFKRAAAKGAAWQVGIYFCDRASADGTGIYPSRQAIADATNLSHRAVRSAIAALERDGYIERDGFSRYGTPMWRLTPQRWPEKPASRSERGKERRNLDPVSESDSDASESTSGMSEPRASVSALGAPKPFLQPSSQPSVEAGACAPAPPVALPKPDLRGLEWQDRKDALAEHEAQVEAQRADYEVALAQWAERHFPKASRRRVQFVVDQARSRGVEPTPENLRAVAVTRPAWRLEEAA